MRYDMAAFSKQKSEADQKRSSHMEIYHEYFVYDEEDSASFSASRLVDKKAGI
jgi:hypothetical protein